MRINFLNSLPVRNNGNIAYTQSTSNGISVPQFTLPKDTVSFTSRTYPTEFSQNVEQALKLGDEILMSLDNGKDKISALDKIKAEYPKIQILSIDKLDNTVPDTMYCAFLQGKLDAQLNPIETKFYVDLNPITKKDKNLNYLFATDVIHEYTHLKQQYDPKFLDMHRKICNNDKLYFDIVQGIGDFIFSTFDNRIQAETVIKTLDLIDVGNLEKYQKLLPRRRHIEITPDSMLKKAGYKDEKNFSDFMNAVLYENTKNSILSVIKTNGENLGDPVYCDRFKSAISTKGGIEKLVNDIREYCKMCAMREGEAYTTEAEFGRRYIKTNKQINLDAVRMYYDLLAKAFD